MGVLLVAPLLLSLRAAPSPTLPRERGRDSSAKWGGKYWAISSWRGLELVDLLAATGLVTYLLFQSRLGLQYVMLPLIMITAWRFGLLGASMAALIASGIAIWSAIQGTGPFFSETLLEKMVTLQVFNVSVALTSFLLACFVETRERQDEMSRLYASAQLGNEQKTRFVHHHGRGQTTTSCGQSEPDAAAGCYSSARHERLLRSLCLRLCAARSGSPLHLLPRSR